MLKRLILLPCLGVLSLGAAAAVLPPEKLLPKETTLMVTAPDSAAAWDLLTHSPYGQLWQRPADQAVQGKIY